MLKTRTGRYVIGSVPFWRRLSLAGTSPVGMIALLALTAQVAFRIPLLLAGAAGWWIFVGVVVVCVAVIVTYTIVGGIRNPPPIFDFDSKEMIIGSDVTPFELITDAISWNPRPKGNDRVLSLGAAHHRRAILVLRSRRLPTISADDRRVVIDAIENSGVRLPSTKPDRYDPSGRFAWMSHPNNRTKEEAISLVSGAKAE